MSNQLAELLAALVISVIAIGDGEAEALDMAQDLAHLITCEFARPRRGGMQIDRQITNGQRLQPA
jgi:CheY-like chemotaxis protein